MRPLENFLDITQFTSLLTEGKKDPRSDCQWWDDCVNQVLQSVCQDHTTTKDTLHEKAKNYALNCLATRTEVNYIDRESVAEHIADEVADDLKDKCFDQRPPASVTANISRTKIPTRPEERFIKLG